MATTAMSALKELIDSESFLTQIGNTGYQGVYYQELPDNLNIVLGDIFLLDHQGEDFDYTTESVRVSLQCSIVCYSNTFERLDQVVVPALIDLLEDYEQSIQIAEWEAYNLEIRKGLKGLMEEKDILGEDIYMAELKLLLEYQRSRKRSTNEFPS